MPGIKVTDLTPEQAINQYKILSDEECGIIIRIGLKGTEMDNADNENLSTNSLAEVFEGAGAMFKQINDINILKLKRKKENTKPSVIEYIGTSKIAVFSLFVMAAVFADSNVLYNQLTRMNNKEKIDNPVAKSIGDSLYVWAVQITALPVKAVFSVGMFIDCLMVLALISIPVTIQALRGKFNNNDSPELSELFHIAIGFIIKPFTYDILNPYILFKDYVPIVSWVLGARKLFSGYTQINAKLGKESTTVSSAESTAAATNTTEKSHSIKPTLSVKERLKNFNNAIKSKFMLPIIKGNSSNITTESVISNYESDPLKEHLNMLGKISSDIALNDAIKAYIDGQLNSSRELKREIAIRYLEPKTSHTKDITLLNGIAIASNDPLLKVLADTYSHTGSKILTEIFQDRKLKNAIIDYLSNPSVNTLGQLQETINLSYQKNMLSTSTHYLPAHKNEFQRIYDHLAQAAGVDLLHDRRNVLPSTVKFSHVSPDPIDPDSSKYSVNFDSKLIQAMKKELAENSGLTKFAKSKKFKYKDEGFALPNDVYIININGASVFIEKTEHYLGGGTSGEVYEGVDLASGQKYALKFLSTKEDVADLEREVRTFNLYYDDQPDKKAFLVTNKDDNVIIMPLLEGKSPITSSNSQEQTIENIEEKANNNSPPKPTARTDVSDDILYTDVQDNNDLYTHIENSMEKTKDHKIKISQHHDKKPTVEDYIVEYNTEHAHKSQQAKANGFVKEIVNLAKSYTPKQPTSKKPIPTSLETPKVKTLDISLDIGLVISTIEIAKAICEAVTKAHEKKIILRDLKPDNFHVYRDSNTGKVTVYLFDFGTSQLLKEGENIIADSSTSAYGTEIYLTPDNLNLNKDMKKNIKSYIVSTKIQALTQIFDNSDNDFKASINKNIENSNREKINYCLENPTLLDNFIYSEKTDAYALGRSLELIIGSTLDLQPIDEDGNLANKYEYAADNNHTKDSESLNLLNGVIQIIQDLKNQALDRKTPKEAIEHLDALLNSNQRKLQP